MVTAKRASTKKVNGSQKNVVRGVRYKRLVVRGGWRFAWSRVPRLSIERMAEKNTFEMTFVKR
jgi:hypothetical protein